MRNALGLRVEIVSNKVSSGGNVHLDKTCRRQDHAETDGGESGEHYFPAKTKPPLLWGFHYDNAILLGVFGLFR